VATSGSPSFYVLLFSCTLDFLSNKIITSLLPRFYNDEIVYFKLLSGNLIIQDMKNIVDYIDFRQFYNYIYYKIENDLIGVKTYVTIFIFMC